SDNNLLGLDPHTTQRAAEAIDFPTDEFLASVAPAPGGGPTRTPLGGLDPSVALGFHC
ncbi:unnamed protein product, partial [Heterosigma akashiwo]